MHLKASGSSEESSPAGSNSDPEPARSQQTEENYDDDHDQSGGRLSPAADSFAGQASICIACHDALHDRMAIDSGTDVFALCQLSEPSDEVCGWASTTDQCGWHKL